MNDSEILALVLLVWIFLFAAKEIYDNESR